MRKISQINAIGLARKSPPPSQEHRYRKISRNFSVELLKKRLGDRLGSNSEPMKLTQVSIDSPPVLTCTVCLGASCGDGRFPFVASNRYHNDYDKSLICLCIRLLISVV